MRPLLDLHGHLNGVALSLEGEVLIDGTWTFCTRARIAAYAALDRLDAIFRIESQQNQRKAA